MFENDRVCFQAQRVDLFTTGSILCVDFILHYKGNDYSVMTIIHLRQGNQDFRTCTIITTFYNRKN